MSIVQPSRLDRGDGQVHQPNRQHDGMDELFRLRAAIRAAGDLVYEWDLADDTIVWHGDLERLFADDPVAVPATGDKLNMRLHPEDLPLRMKALSDHLARGTVYDCEYRLRAADGAFQWVHDRGAVSAARNGGGRRLVGALRLVTRRKENEARLEYLANYDDLTGHFNKVRLRKSLDQAVAEALRFGSTGGFAVFGLDQLAMINSAYGHQAGDAVLMEVGKRLHACLRGTDVIGRVAGDRFGVLLARCNQHEAWRAAERAVQEIRRRPVDTPAGPVRVTATAGIVIFPSHSRSSYDIMAKAEDVMRQAKTNGRNRTGLYDMTEAQRESYRASLDIGAEVEEALREQRLVFAYQPIMYADQNEVFCYECLLRLRRQNGEIVSAGRFVPVVEQLGLMRALDHQVLEIAVEELRRYPDARLAINISGLTASDPSWLRALVGKLKDHEDVARRLTVEITETAALRDIDESARFVQAVRELGCRLALDDFGAGFTNFQHLKALTADIVKIDGSFVRNIAVEPQNQLFVRNLLSLAKSLNLAAVAECVETGEEARILQEEGADLLQGYYFGKPSLEKPWDGAAKKGNGAVVSLAAHDGRRVTGQ